VKNFNVIGRFLILAGLFLGLNAQAFSPMNDSAAVISQAISNRTVLSQFLMFDDITDISVQSENLIKVRSHLGCEIEAKIIFQKSEPNVYRETRIIENVEILSRKTVQVEDTRGCDPN